MPALLFPALGNICIQYVTPLIVAALAGRIVDGMPVDFPHVAPWILGFAAMLLIAEVLFVRRDSSERYQGSPMGY